MSRWFGCEEDRGGVELSDHGWNEGWAGGAEWEREDYVAAAADG